MCASIGQFCGPYSIVWPTKFKKFDQHLVSLSAHLINLRDTKKCLSEFEVRTVSNGSSFSPVDLGPTCLALGP